MAHHQRIKHMNGYVTHFEVLVPSPKIPGTHPFIEIGP